MISMLDLRSCLEVLAGCGMLRLTRVARIKFCAAEQSFVRPDKVLFGYRKICTARRNNQKRNDKNETLVFPTASANYGVV
jgi:hypothetical protein